MFPLNGFHTAGVELCLRVLKRNAHSGLINSIKHDSSRINYHWGLFFFFWGKINYLWRTKLKPSVWYDPWSMGAKANSIVYRGKHRCFSWQAREREREDCTVKCECVCVSSGFLDQAGLEVRVAAWGAAQQQVLLVDQAVQQVLLSVVVVDLQEGHHSNPEPGEPCSPQAKLKDGRKSL